MAVGTPTLRLNQTASPDSNDPWASDSISPAADTALIVSAVIEYTTTPADAATIDGAGLTWNQVDAYVSVAGVAAEWQHVVWEGRGTPSTGALTVTPPGALVMSNIRIQALEFPGAETGSSPVRAANMVRVNAGAAGFTATTPSFPETYITGNALYASFGNSGNHGGDPTERSGWTEAAVTPGELPNSGSQTQYRLSSDTAASITWGLDSAVKTGIAFEILEAAASGPRIVVTANNDIQ